MALTAGSAIAFGVSILASPITSRLFMPEEFGLAALFMSGATYTLETHDWIQFAVKCGQMVLDDGRELNE